MRMSSFSGAKTMLFHSQHDEVEVRAEALRMSLAGEACSVWPQEMRELAMEWAAGCEVVWTCCGLGSWL